MQKKSPPLISIYAKRPLKEHEKISSHIGTVGDLKKVLAKYPDDLPLQEDEGYLLVWFNVGKAEPNGECLGIEVDDGTWTPEDRKNFR